jgi:hypothetical protein
MEIDAKMGLHLAADEIKLICSWARKWPTDQPEQTPPNRVILGILLSHSSPEKEAMADIAHDPLIGASKAAANQTR